MKNYIYGAGIYGKAILSVAEENIDLFIDKYSQQGSFNKTPIVQLSRDLDKNATVYIALSDTYIEPLVVKQLTEFGFTNLIGLNDTLKKFPDAVDLILQDIIWFVDDKNKLLDKGKIQQVRGLLSDEKSLVVIDRISEFRENPSVSSYVEPDLDRHYFPKDIEWKDKIDNINFVDGGAFTGDTIHSLMEISKEIGKEVDSVTCFEPDIMNRVKLVASLATLSNRIEKSFIFPCGLWSEDKVLRFNSGIGSCSNVTSSESGDYIMGVSIDTALLSSKPNFIKMDIEGSEIDAILGARKTIRDRSPILAIAIYHKPDDLWNIPLLINEINPNYDMHITVYGSFLQELVLYCIPKHKKK